MPLIVDTYNVLHVTGVLPPDIAGIDVDGLAALIAASRFRRQRVTLVCDGTAPEGASRQQAGLIAVHYTGPSCTADEQIAAMVKTSSAPRRLTVVSSDRAVLRTARRRRCPTLTSEEFLARLAADREWLPPRKGAKPAPPAPLEDEAVDRWVAEFDVGDMKPDEAVPPESPAVEPTPPPSPARSKKRYESVLPGDLIAEAEAIVEQGDSGQLRLPEHLMPAERTEDPDVATGDEPPAEEAGSSAVESPQPQDTAKGDAPPSPDALAAMLPPGLVEQAESLVAEHVADESAAAQAPETKPQADAPEPPPPPDPMRAMLPDVLVEQAEALARGDEADAPPATRAPARDEPGARVVPPAVESLPASVLEEAERLWRAEREEDADDPKAPEDDPPRQ